jgi:hypothetical protein
VDYWRYKKARREYEELTGEEFPGLGEDRQRKERQKAAEERAAREEANRAEEDVYQPPRRLPFASHRRRRRFK